MARPKRGDGAPDAREALMQAFWELLRTNELHQISIGMIASAAHYNRGTFYYYFSDKDEFIEAAVESELSDMPGIVFKILAGTEEIGAINLTSEHLRRLSLFMGHGGRNILERNVKSYLVTMWTALVAPKSGQLTSETRIILEYISSGILGVLAYLGTPDGEPEVKPTSFSAKFLRDSSAVGMQNLCAAEGVSRDEIVARLRMLERVNKATLART